MTNIRVRIINWQGERIPFSNIMTRQNTTKLSSKINFLGHIQSEPWRTEIHPGNPEVQDTGNWPQPQNCSEF